MWARNGRELFYLDTTNRLTAMALQAGTPTFTPGSPRRILETVYFAGNQLPTYHVSPDGQRFLMIKEQPADGAQAAPARLVVVLNWVEELKRLAPAR